jgi:hypothetical protein
MSTAFGLGLRLTVSNLDISVFTENISVPTTIEAYGMQKPVTSGPAVSITCVDVWCACVQSLSEV